MSATCNCDVYTMLRQSNSMAQDSTQQEASMEYTAEEQAYRDKLIREIEEMRVMLQEEPEKPKLKVVE